MELFDDTEAQAERSAHPSTSDAVEQATALWSQVATQEPLSETLDALKRIPQAIQPQVEKFAAGLFRSEFIKLATTRFSTSARARDPAFGVAAIAHSAKLAAFSAVSHLAASPWHLADSALLKRIGSDLLTDRGLDSALEHFQSVPCINLFVAALETDDRVSYLKSVKALLSHHKVQRLVLDDELIEWQPESDFLAACSEVGIRPMHVGIANRGAAFKHSMLRPDSSLNRAATLYVDTQGRQLTLSESGELKLPRPESPTPVAAKPEAARPVSKPAAPAAEAAAATAPSSAMQARIQNLRAQQARRAARP